MLGKQPNPDWTTVANGLPVLLDPATGVRPEFEGYAGDTIKQADVVMLTYPWEWQEPANTGSADLDYYAARTDPDGPAMTDSIHAIDSLALGVAGCPAYHYTLRSVLPFVQPPYDQFTEARSGQGTFTFLTVAIEAKRTTVTLDSGSAVTVEGPKGSSTLAPGGTVTLPTRRLRTAGCS